MKYIGIFIIVAGLITTFYTLNNGSEEHVYNKPLETSEDAPFQWWPLTGVVISAVGATIVWFDFRKRKNSVRIPKSKEDTINKPDSKL